MLTTAQSGSSVAHMDSTQYAAAVARNVDEALRRANRSVLATAAATGIPRTTLDRRLRSSGGSPFSVAELKALADFTGTTVRDLATVYEPVDAERIPA